jgi:hypothetical protein
MSQIGNKILAIFMGHNVWETEKGNFMVTINGTSGLVNEILPYDSDWNLIFQVIEKIESLGYHVTIAKHQCQIYNKNYHMEVDADFYDNFIENTYDGITAFVNWYSQRPASWSQEYSLPSKTEDKKHEVIQSLMEDLFHMDNSEADKIKKQYKKKYYFLTEDDIKNL